MVADFICEQAMGHYSFAVSNKKYNYDAKFKISRQ